MRALANEGLASAPPTSPVDELEVIISPSLPIPMLFAFGGATEVEDDIDGVPHRVLLAAATALSNSPLFPRLFTFDDDDDDPGPNPPSVDCGPLEPEFSPEVGDTFEGFEIEDDATATAAAFAAAALSILFKNGLGKFSSSAKSYSGEGWFLGTGIGSDLAAAAAAMRLELLPDGRK